MRLNAEQLSYYQERGYLLLPELFSQAEVAALKAELPLEFGTDSERRVLEKNGTVVRSVYGSHRANRLFEQLSRHPRLVEPAMQILGSRVYVYQFKINAKAAFGGDVWEWHQDFIFWRNEDGLGAPHLTNMVLFLDEVNEFNGPLLLIEGSHAEGAVEVGAKPKPAEYHDSPAWISNLTADLKYSLDRAAMTRLVERHAIVAPKGPSGSVLLFHPNLVHGSSPNMSPFDRAICIATYNSVENLPRPQGTRRPEFIVSRDATPIMPIPDDGLLRGPVGPAA